MTLRIGNLAITRFCMPLEVARAHCFGHALRAPNGASNESRSIQLPSYIARHRTSAIRPNLGQGLCFTHTLPRALNTVDLSASHAADHARDAGFVLAQSMRLHRSAN